MVYTEDLKFSAFTGLRVRVPPRLPKKNDLASRGRFSVVWYHTLMKYDVIVVGLGAMGSAATYQLAKSGAKVLGIDRYSPPHIYGSTHGDTRITRLGIGEGAEYVPLVQRSHEIWREIEQEVGYELFDQCGGLVMAVQGGPGLHGVNQFLNQTIAAAKQYGIKHETLTTEQIKTRFPQFHLSGTEDGYYEPEAGLLRPEKCVQAQLELAKKHGAQINFDEQVISYADSGDKVIVTTDKGTYTAGKLIVAAGPWINELLPELAANFKIYRQVLCWFDLKDRTQYQRYATMPIYIWEFGASPDDFIYGFPMIDGPDGGAKVASEDYLQETSPDRVEREVTQAEIERIYNKYVRDHFPALSSKCIKAKSCLYTVTPDHGFVIDVHPEHQNVIIASPCSGHGFKHSAAIGEVLAQLATQGKSRLDISSFSLTRFKF